MSAVGKLGTHKYRNHSTQDWTDRTTYICEDIMPLQFKDKKRTAANLKQLELIAINNPKGKLRHVLNKGLYKHKPEDFEKLRDVKKEIKELKIRERENRLENFAREMDTFD